MAALEQTMAAPGFWDDQARAKRTMSQSKRLKAWLDPLNELASACADLTLLDELAESEDDASASAEIESELERLEERLDGYELLLMFKDEDDDKSAILTIHPGAGGTESADWAEMLWRMYQRYCERQGWQTELLDFQRSDEAGIKSVSVEVKGDFAYGRLKAERGVHRLVRISPFDAQSRRHTSFASVFVYPEVEEAGDIELDEADLKVDTFRASGAGGQHVNKTSSAVRITHIPTGIVVSCQDERSQHRNRENALKILMARLYQLRREEEEAARQKLEDSKTEIGWGNQIRSYVFHPYSMVKDHRTGVETGNVQAVMDGDLDRFVEAWLKKSSGMAVGDGS
ncbi:MAG: peptide chain release factor 2 [Candidatus Latescibacteria bacterium]|nr:peptide chain release factor 2 [bacterium]MCB9515033.1 peptide chain release factor 2 [Candidatus Latescibacterota bacterium]